MKTCQMKRKPNAHKRQGMLDIPLNEEVQMLDYGLFGYGAGSCRDL